MSSFISAFIPAFIPAFMPPAITASKFLIRSFSSQTNPHIPKRLPLHKPSVLLLALPGRAAYGPSHIRAIGTALENQGVSTLFQVGDGKRAIAEEDLHNLVTYTQATNRDSFLNQQKPLLFIMGHGFNNHHNHYLELSGEDPSKVLDTAHFLSLLIRCMHGRPLDIFLTACQGATAAKTLIPQFTPGTNFVALSQDRPAYSSDLEALWLRLASPALKNFGIVNAEQLVTAYLLSLSPSASMPFIYSVGMTGRTYSPYHTNDPVSLSDVSPCVIKTTIQKLKTLGVSDWEIRDCIDHLHQGTFSSLDPRESRKDLQAHREPNRGLALAFRLLSKDSPQEKSSRQDLPSPLFEALS